MCQKIPHYKTTHPHNATVYPITRPSTPKNSTSHIIDQYLAHLTATNDQHPQYTVIHTKVKLIATPLPPHQLLVHPHDVNPAHAIQPLPLTMTVIFQPFPWQVTDNLVAVPCTLTNSSNGTATIISSHIQCDEHPDPQS